MADPAGPDLLRTLRVRSDRGLQPGCRGLDRILDLVDDIPAHDFGQIKRLAAGKHENQRSKDKYEEKISKGEKHNRFRIS